MEKTLFDKGGEAVAYISDNYQKTIYLWDGSPVSYLYDEKHVYGINGRHLGWFMDSIVYNNNGERIGFTSNTCPVAIAKEPVKNKKQVMDEIRPRWKAPPPTKLSPYSSNQNLADFLKEGQVARFLKASSTEKSTKKSQEESRD